MPRTYRSKRGQRADLISQLRAEGQTRAQIAARIKEDEHVNSRVAMRLAHGWTQSQMAMMWNEQWPAKDGGPGITDKHISNWETWPQSGHEPSLKTLKRLAQLCQCDVGDLIDDGSYSYLDPAKRAAKALVSSPNQLAASPHAFGELATVDAEDRNAGQPSRELGQLAMNLGQEPYGEKLGRWLGPIQRLIQLATQQSNTPLQREALYEQMIRLLATWADTMERREFLRMFGWAATATAATPVLAELNLDEQERVARVLGAQDRIDEAVIGHIESVFWSAMRQDDTLGPQAALDTVLAQRNLLRAVLPECPAHLRQRTLSLFSNLSRFAGWLCFDLSEFDSASYYYEQARTAAHEAENTELGIFVLCNLSHLATWRGQPRVAIDHAVAAQGWAGETDDLLLRAYVADVGARAYATAGRRRACIEKLGSIPDNIEHTVHTPATSLVYFYGLGQYT